jgi:hypothetical protein
MGFFRAPAFIGAIVGAVAALTLTTGAVRAQQAQRFTGEVESVKGDDVTVKKADGQVVHVVLDKDLHVNHAVKASLADIKPGSFIGTGAYPDGNSWKAAEVHIFPQGSRQGEGHRTWSSDPSGTMTNAEVTAAVVESDRDQLTLTTNGQNYKITVPPEAPIVRFETGSKALVKKGAWIGVSNGVEKNGQIAVKAITVSDDRRYPVR